MFQTLSEVQAKGKVIKPYLKSGATEHLDKMLNNLQDAIVESQRLYEDIAHALEVGRESR